jgi:hypothetical protein
MEAMFGHDGAARGGWGQLAATGKGGGGRGGSKGG